MATSAPRRVAGITTLLALLFVVLVTASAPGAQAGHIPDTGPVPANCVEFQLNTTGARSPSNVSGVTITLTAWDADEHGFAFTVSGLVGSRHVDISVKSGQAIDEPGGFGNGPHSFAHERRFGISHVRLCVFVDSTASIVASETTVAGETTTRGGEPTSTTQPTTNEPSATVSELTTTTSEQATTTEQPTTTISDPTTTTNHAEVAGGTGPTAPPADSAGTLPVTGPGSGAVLHLGLVALLAGLALLLVGRVGEDDAVRVDRPTWSGS